MLVVGWGLTYVSARRRAGFLRKQNWWKPSPIKRGYWRGLAPLAILVLSTPIYYICCT